MGQTFGLGAHRWRLWSGIVPGLGLLADTTQCLGTLSLSLQYTLWISQPTFLFWGEILHYFCFVLGCLLSLSLLTRGNKRNKQKQGISCLAAIDTGLTALQRARHLRLWMEESAATLSQTCRAEPDQGPTWLPVWTSVSHPCSRVFTGPDGYGCFKINWKWGFQS